MDKNYLLTTPEAREIYTDIASLPIIDYHCHLSPREIYEDRPFENIAELWLGADHYKWRLMRTAGIDEYYITGKADPHEKFLKYAQALEFAAGNPLYHWSHMELSLYFGIDRPLRSDTAEEIYREANQFIRQSHLSPRALIRKARVETLCTTDDVTDSLEFHEKLAADKSFPVRVLPSFRTDRALMIRQEDYPRYLQTLSDRTGQKIESLAEFQTALIERLDDFCRHGCRFSDVGIPFFPTSIATPEQADRTFRAALKGDNISDRDFDGFLGYMYVFLAGEYKKRGMVMQMHLAVYRNACSRLYQAAGADCGVDCVGNPIDGTALIRLLDAMDRSGLPKTILYTLNPAFAEQMASIAGAFPGVRCGAAWWFCDHKRGIEQQMKIIAENGSLGAFLGMLTDSRSFLSYARHDYFRRIAADLLGCWVSDGEYDRQSAAALARKISYENIKEWIGA